MLKLRKYLKPFIGSIFVIVVFLFSQAMCELAMPDYMSSIVDVGIVSGGIEDGVPDVIRQSEVNKLFLFMDEKQIETFNQGYTLIESSDANEEQLENYPILKEENVYERKSMDDEQRDEIKVALRQAEMTVMSLENAEEMRNSDIDEEDLTAHQKEMLEMLNKIPEGVDIFTVLQQLPQDQLLDLKAEMTKSLETLGGETADTANATYIREEYQKIGLDADAIQYDYLISHGLMMLAVALGSAGSAVVVGFFASRLAAKLSRNLRKDVFTKVENFSNAEFNKFSTNTLITRTTNDIQQIQMMLVMFMRVVIYAPIIGVGALIKVVNANVSMTWIIALIIVLILSVMMVAFAFVMPKFKKLQKLLDKLNSVVREILDGMPVIRAFNNQKEEDRKFEKANRDILKTNLFTTRAMASLIPIVMLIMNCASVLIVWVGAHQIDSGSLMVGDMIAFTQYSMQIIMAFMMITMISIMLPRASAAAGRIVEVLDTEASIKDPVNPKTFDPSYKGYVEFQNVSFRYPGAQEDVLHDISFVAKPGETTAFIGSTGSGKSTIINLVPRFFDVSEGTILVDGIDIKEVSQHDLRDKIGYVPQKGSLFTGTIESNLLYAKEDATQEEIESAASVAQALDFINEKPERFETPIAQGGTNVSGGQRQRLSIARALVKNPEIYIFDDTFSALDFKTDAKLRKALNELCQKNKSTVLLVAQRISSIMHADRIVVLDKGRVAGMGTHEELLKTCDVYKEIAYSQLSKEELDHE
ncbi:ABC transporter ATP-binding protein [Erysipelotrichaceae bacterium HCN-30851]